MKILLPAAEAVPLYKVGGLGDVVGSLPKALNIIEQDARIVLPKYPQINLDENWTVVDEFEVIYEHKLRPVKVWEGRMPKTGVITYLMEESHYLTQNHQEYYYILDQFAFFSLAVAQWIAEISPWKPNVVHLNDWHVALIPLLLKQKFPEVADEYKYLFTVHNLAYQGISGNKLLNKLGLNTHQSQFLAWDAENGDIDFLMEGLVNADMVSTVSPTYAKEILTPELGMKLNDILKGMEGKIHGILNGLDMDAWNPQTDDKLILKYDVNSWQTGKNANKLAVQNEVGLEQNKDKVLIGFVGRLDPSQKGVNLILDAIYNNQLDGHAGSAQMQMVILGTGDPNLENELRSASARYENLSAIIKFDTGLARRIYAGCDFLLVPSKFEPCGLIQMIAMRYGAIPIVRQTGGLADTVREGETGFLFPDFNWESMMETVRRATNSCQNNDCREKIVKNCMNQDWSWEKSAKEYVKLYEELILR